MALILVVDDDADIIEIVERALRQHAHTVVSARTGRQALMRLQEKRPDLVILDIVLPELSGIEICKFMRTHPQLSPVPIIFLTFKEAIEDKIAGFEAGGDDYLTKPFHLDELEMRVRALLRHTGHSSVPGVIVVGPVRLDPADSSAFVDGRSVDLTPIEFRLLHYMLSHAGQVMSTERLLQDVWEYPSGSGNLSLVRMHVLNLRRKIERDPHSPKLIRTVPRHGYVFPLDPDS
mgnify:CR=1 FL=1